MRDPKRIAEMINLVQSIWHMYPDMRLGQLMHFIETNAMSEIEKDPFYIEDDEWKNFLLEMLNK